MGLHRSHRDAGLRAARSFTGADRARWWSASSAGCATPPKNSPRMSPMRRKTRAGQRETARVSGRLPKRSPEPDPVDLGRSRRSSQVIAAVQPEGSGERGRRERQCGGAHMAVRCPARSCDQRHRHRLSRIRLTPFRAAISLSRIRINPNDQSNCIWGDGGPFAGSRASARDRQGRRRCRTCPQNRHCSAVGFQLEPGAGSTCDCGRSRDWNFAPRTSARSLR